MSPKTTRNLRRSKPKTATALGFNLVARDGESVLTARVRIKTRRTMTQASRNNHAALFADQIMKAAVEVGGWLNYGFRLSTMRVRRAAR